MAINSVKRHALTEDSEKKYLSLIIKKLSKAKDKIENRVEKYEEEILKDKDYIWENLAAMDGAEKAVNRMLIHETIDSGELALSYKRKIEKLIESPYFGRVDFEFEESGVDSTKSEPFYIGLHNFSENPGDPILIYDWRAPISTLFYDFEKGHANYNAPSGPVKGVIDLKRQFKIRNSKMEYMIESSLNIGDDVLQKELSTTSDKKMKNIVVTIQRQQNEIIRNSTADNLIVQGVAGSGKTSIALHRVAFLLYRYRGNLNSDNIMIISPNKVFADYISNVLPELGEENIQEIGIEEIADEILRGKYKFKTFAQQVSGLISKHDSEEIERISYKAGEDFARLLSDYLENAAVDFFEAKELYIDGIFISKKEIRENYVAGNYLKIQARLEKTALDTITRAKLKSYKTILPATAQNIKRKIIQMYKYKSAMELYKGFFTHHGLEKFYISKKGNSVEYDDLFPLCLTNLYWQGCDSFKNIKHLLVDEMQDYTPVQYSVLFKIFKCKKTIMGDINQSVNPYTSSSLEKIKKHDENSQCVEMLRSYRCSFEITNFARKISGNYNVIPVERHGSEPEIIECKSISEQIEKIIISVNEFIQSENKTCGIICKTDKLAEEVFSKVKGISDEIYLLDSSSTEYKQGIVVTSSHMSKGLEFDYVIIPNVDTEHYSDELDKNLLYIACTRAMHKLDLFYYGEKSKYLK